MELIFLSVIIVLLSIIMFFSLKKLIDVVNKDAKKYYFNKMTELDKKIDEKNMVTSFENTEDNIKKEKEIKGQKENSIDYKLLDLYNNVEYANGNALKIANKVDEIFNINDEDVIIKFLKNIVPSENASYYQSILDRFSPNLIYKLKMLNKDNQIKEISKMLSEKELTLFNDYLKTHKFNLNKYILDLNECIDEKSPVIEIITGNKNKNYNYLNPNIKTTYSDDIYKGIIIKYQAKIYDYSINERDV